MFCRSCCCLLLVRNKVRTARIRRRWGASRGRRGRWRWGTQKNVARVVGIINEEEAVRSLRNDMPRPGLKNRNDAGGSASSSATKINCAEGITAGIAGAKGVSRSRTPSCCRRLLPTATSP